MSKATNQSIVFFSVAAGALVRILQDDLFSALYMRDHTFGTYKKMITAMEQWPKTGDTQKNLRWIYKKIDEWELHIKKCGDYYNVAVFAAIASRCLCDIESQVKDRNKIILIGKLKDDILKIENFTDPTGERWDVLEKADELMTGLYKIVDWHLSEKYKMKRIDPKLIEEKDSVFTPTPLQKKIFKLS